MKNLKLFICVVLLAISYNPANAQPGWDDDDPIDTPIDGSVFILVVAGFAYGVRKIKENQLKKKTKPLITLH